MNYARETPKGKDNVGKQNYPPAEVALAASTNEAAITSSILLLNNQTTEILILPTVNSAFRWLSQTVIDSSVAATSVLTAIATANFDFTAPANVHTRVVLPQIAAGNNTSIAAARDIYGLPAGLAMKTTVAAGSILTVQY